MVEQVGQTPEGDQVDGDKKGLVVTIHNEDAGGKPFRIPGQPETPISSIVDAFYTVFGSPHQDGDRLYCLMNGDDVFAHSTEELGQYAEHVCKNLEWGFSRATGGA